MSEKIKIGSYQGPIKENDFDANLKNVYKIIEETKKDKLDFLCFPETYLSGYKPDSIKESSVSLDDKRLLKLFEDTKNLDTVFLLGLSERKEDGIYNAQIVFYKGEFLGKQYKTMLTQGYDDKHFKPSLEMNVFEAKGIKFGIAICHTTSFVEPAQYLRWKGARLLFTPHFNDITPYIKTPDGHTFGFWPHREMVLNNQAALATLLKMVVVRSNITVANENQLGAGDSNIWDMDGKCVAKGTPFFEEVVMHEFDKDIFVNEHWIDRREIPVELMKMMYDAVKEYKRD